MIFYNYEKKFIILLINNYIRNIRNSYGFKYDNRSSGIKNTVHIAMEPELVT